MKIFHILISFDEKDGGPPRGLATLACMQSQKDVVSVAPLLGRPESMIIKPGKYHNLVISKPITSRCFIWAIKYMKRKITSMIKEADIVHIHSNWRYHLVVAAKASLKYGKPYIIRPAGNLGIVPRSNKRHAKRLYFKFVEKKYFDKASAIHCCTTKELNELKDLKIKAPKFVIPQPVDNSLLDFKDDEFHVDVSCKEITDESKVILFLGRFSWIKQLSLLVEAFSNIHRDRAYLNLHLILAGPWEDKLLVQKIIKRINELELNSVVHLPGMVKGKQKSYLLRKADIFVLPSKHENFGVSVAEALLFGKPCVVSEGVALAKEIDEYLAGCVFNETVDDLEVSLRRLLDDECFYKKCSKNAYELSKRFYVDQVSNDLRAKYLELIKEKNA